MRANITTHEISRTLQTCLAGLAEGGAESGRLDDDTNLFELGIDAMNMPELVARIEERFGLMLTQQEMSAQLFARFGRLVDFVRQKMADE
ncbi:acyl carrier protein [Pelomonas sp. CA6]|uniref:acyl carrier protein n=1 Tax=Pelomonas sp. CA6 TaxID=2907999 RepID=UPI001F4BDD70|nr:acyl carrier protein [Pelomonas sp. CA6]MCH7344776.1 acyl carrier protein [Pelomonas sp. CA6]